MRTTDKSEPNGTRHLTPDEHRILDRALSRSTKVVARGRDARAAAIYREALERISRLTPTLRLVDWSKTIRGMLDEANEIAKHALDQFPPETKDDHSMAKGNPPPPKQPPLPPRDVCGYSGIANPIIHDPEAVEILRDLIKSGYSKDQIMEAMKKMDATQPPPADDRFTLDDDGYPTQAALDAVEHWPHGEYRELMERIRTIWYLASWGWSEEDRGNEGVRYALSTGGWSGNESIIDALSRNQLFWANCWVSSRRGGHHVFEVERPHAD